MDDLVTRLRRNHFWAEEDCDIDREAYGLAADNMTGRSEVPEYEDDAVDWTPKQVTVVCPVCVLEVPSRCTDPKWCDFNIDEADVLPR